MDRFCFLHAADLHLDTPMEGIGSRLPASWAARLRDASLTALERLVETAIREQVAFVLLAGDIYDGPERGARAQVRLAQALRRMSEAGIDVLIVQGNHDPLEDGFAFGSTLPPRVTLDTLVREMLTVDAIVEIARQAVPQQRVLPLPITN